MEEYQVIDNFEARFGAKPSPPDGDEAKAWNDKFRAYRDGFNDASRFRVDFQKGEMVVFPKAQAVKNWMFPGAEIDEAVLADALTRVGAKSGLDANDFQHLFPAVLRMLRNHSAWSGTNETRSGAGETN